jgi:Fibronectin type III domain
MTNAERGRGSRRGVYLCAVAALGFALSGCGGSVGRSVAGASAAAGTQPADSAVSSQGAATAQGSAGQDSGQDTTPAQGTSSVATTGSGLTGGSPPAAAAGTVTIDWQPPTENVDGSALTNLAGYHIHYGVSSGNYTQTISVSNPGIATYVVSNLTPGTYYFAVAAVNYAGTESPLSSEVSATVTN